MYVHKDTKGISNFATVFGLLNPIYHTFAQLLVLTGHYVIYRADFRSQQALVYICRSLPTDRLINREHLQSSFATKKNIASFVDFYLDYFMTTWKDTFENVDAKFGAEFKQEDDICKYSDYRQNSGIHFYNNFQNIKNLIFLGIA